MLGLCYSGDSLATLVPSKHSFSGRPDFKKTPPPSSPYQDLTPRPTGQNKKGVSDRTILHLCADIGSDSKPYREAGYNVVLVGWDVGIENYHPPKDVWGIIANPPCTHFSVARTAAKTPRDLREGMRLVKECLRVIWECQYDLAEGTRTTQLKWWVLENPSTGLLKDFLGKPSFTYCPSEYGADFTKRTALWGKFNHPDKPFFLANKLHRRSLAGTHVTKLIDYPRTEEGRIQIMNDRSKAYEPFTKAFFAANP